MVNVDAINEGLRGGDTVQFGNLGTYRVNGDPHQCRLQGVDTDAANATAYVVVRKELPFDADTADERETITIPDGATVLGVTGNDVSASLWAAVPESEYGN